MELVQSREARDVRFSKRRQTLFQKLCDFSALSGRDTLALVYSPSGNLFSFGAPDARTAAARFLGFHDAAAGGAPAPAGPPQAPKEQPPRELLDLVRALEERLGELKSQRKALARAHKERLRAAGGLPPLAEKLRSLRGKLDGGGGSASSAGGALSEPILGMVSGGSAAYAQDNAGKGAEDEEDDDLLALLDILSEED